MKVSEERLYPAYTLGAWHVKQAQPHVCYSLAGRLYAARSRLLLQTPRSLLHGALDALDAAGVRLPTLDEAPLSIEVMSPEELERLGGPQKITERGHFYHYTLGRIREGRQNGGGSFWWFQVHSPELSALRTSYGLSPLPSGGFRLIFAYRPPGVLQTGPTSKLVEASIAPHYEDPYWPMAKLAALGIPDRSNYGDLSKLTPGELAAFVIQHHLAQRAGPHFDIRIGTPSLGLFSWATRKELPQPGERIAIFRQPVHAFPYKDFEGSLRGYGAGTVRRHEAGEAFVTKASPDAIQFVLAHRATPERFIALRPPNWRPNDWLLINVTRRTRPDVEKSHFALLDESRAEELLSQIEPGATVQPKVDGASTVIELSEHGPELYSYRTSQRSQLPIVYTEKVLRERARNVRLPRHLKGMVLAGEVYGVHQHEDGTEQVIPVEELSGLLNSRLGRSLAEQKARSIALKVLLFDVARGPGGRPAPADRAERVALLQEAIKYLPEEHFGIMPGVSEPEEAVALWRTIAAGEHPLTREGIVIHPSQGQPRKLKTRKEMDVYIRGIFRGTGKHANRAGGFEYSLTPDGPVIGRVGTGLSDSLREALWQDQDEFIGRKARVAFQEQLPSGALRLPALIALHEG